LQYGVGSPYLGWVIAAQHPKQFNRVRHVLSSSRDIARDNRDIETDCNRLHV
jgi:hypothetical protein